MSAACPAQTSYPRQPQWHRVQESQHGSPVGLSARLSSRAMSDSTFAFTCSKVASLTRSANSASRNSTSRLSRWSTAARSGLWLTKQTFPKFRKATNTNLRLSHENGKITPQACITQLCAPASRMVSCSNPTVAQRWSTHDPRWRPSILAWTAHEASLPPPQNPCGESGAEGSSWWWGKLHRAHGEQLPFDSSKLCEHLQLACQSLPLSVPSRDSPRMKLETERGDKISCVLQHDLKSNQKCCK